MIYYERFEHPEEDFVDYLAGLPRDSHSYNEERHFLSDKIEVNSNHMAAVSSMKSSLQLSPLKYGEKKTYSKEKKNRRHHSSPMRSPSANSFGAMPGT